MCSRFRCLAPLLGLLLPTGLVAQTRTDSADHEAVRAQLIPSQEGLRGSGERFHVEFEAGGFRYQPEQGAAVLPLDDLRYRFESVSRGERLVFQADGRAMATAAGLVAEYSHTEHLVERYEMHEDGIAQSFVFHELPQGSGDLVVRGRLETSLEILESDPESGLLFETHGAGPLRYGGVTGIDANGATAQGWIHLEGKVLELGLPAEFVERAALPIVLDPLLGSAIAWFPNVMSNSPSDAAFLNGYTLLVYKAEPHVLLGRMYDATLGLDSMFILSSLNVGDRVLRPAIGTLDNVNLPRFIVAWEQDIAGTNNHDLVYSAVVPGANGPALTAFLASTNANEIHVDLSRGSFECTAVWEEAQGGIRGKVFGVSGVQPMMTIGATQTLSTDSNDSRPAIGTYDNAGRLVVWHRDLGNNQEIRANYWDDATPNNPEFVVRTSASELADPDCDGGAKNDFFVVWAEGEAAGSTSHDIRGRRAFFPGGSGTLNLGPILDIENDTNDDELRPLIRFTGNAYIVAFYDQVGAPGTFWSLETRWIDSMNGHVLDGAAVRIVNQLSRFGFVAEDRKGNDIDTGTLTWPDVQGGADWMYRQEIESPGGYRNDIRWTGCDDGGETRISTASEANPALRFELWDGEPGQLAYLIAEGSRLDLPIGLAVLVPDILVADVYTAPATSAHGYTGVDLALPPGLSGTTFWAQWLTLATDFTCTGYRVNLAEALELTID